MSRRPVSVPEDVFVVGVAAETRDTHNVRGPGMSAGKDAFVNFLVDYHGFERVAAGDYVKQEISQVIRAGWPLPDELLKALGWFKVLKARIARFFSRNLLFLNGLSRSQEFILTAIEIRDLCRQLEGRDPWEKPTDSRMRRLMQIWGTEFRRFLDPDYWVKLTRQDILWRIEEGSRRFAVSDVRFWNEYFNVEDLCGVNVLIIRPLDVEFDPTAQMHRSEAELADAPFREEIINNGTLEDLRQMTAAFVRCLPAHREYMNSFWQESLSDDAKGSTAA